MMGPRMTFLQPFYLWSTARYLGLPWVVQCVLSRFIWRCCVVCENCCDCILVVGFIWRFIHEQQVFCFEIKIVMIVCRHSACVRCFPKGFCSCNIQSDFHYRRFLGDGGIHHHGGGEGNVQPKRYVALPAVGSWYTWICSSLVCVFNFHVWRK